MSIFTSKSGKELGGGGERLSKGKEITGSHTIDHHVQILSEESMVMHFYTNMVFLFCRRRYYIYALSFDELSAGGICSMYSFHWKIVKGRQKHGHEDDIAGTKD